MTAIKMFDFESQLVRVQSDTHNDPWWVAADVCRVLEIRNVTQAVGRLDDDEKATLCNTEGGGRAHTLNLINESGLYALILRSRKPQARRFRKWITSEVLPEIRKTGAYVAPDADIDALRNRLTKLELTTKQSTFGYGVAVERIEILESQIQQKSELRYMTAREFCREFQVQDSCGGRPTPGSLRANGRKIAELSRRHGVEIRPRPDDAFGFVATYRVDVLMAWRMEFDMRNRASRR